MSLGIPLLCNWLAEIDYKVFVDQEQITVERLEITNQQKHSVALILFLTRVFIGLGAVIVWIKNR